MSEDEPRRNLPPHTGVRLPDAVREIALRKVEECLLMGMRAPDILAQLAEINATESISTVRHWICEVRQRMADADAEHRPMRRQIRRAQLEARYQIALADMAEARMLPNTPSKHMAMAMLHRSVAQLEQLMIEIDGLKGPIKIEHSGQVDILAMSPDQRRNRIEELLAKRQAALAAGNVETDEEAVH